METVIKNEAEEDFAVLHGDLQVNPEPADRMTSAELLHELYRDHVVKEEMVVGPVVLKPGPFAELESRDVTPDSSVRKQLSPCGLCGQDMASSLTLTQHKCTHASDTSSCNTEEQGEEISTKLTIDICKEDSKLKSSLYKHMQRFHRSTLAARTPGRAIRPTSEVVEFQKSPGGHVRPIDPPRPMRHDVLESVEAIDVSDEEAEGLMQRQQCREWIREVGDGEGQVDPSMSSVPNATAQEGVSDDWRIPSSPKPGPSNVQSVPRPASVEADVRPSSSGETTTSEPVRRQRESDSSDLESDHNDEFEVVPSHVDAMVGDIVRDIPDDEELEINERTFINDVQREMDVAADRLPCVSDSWAWESDFESFRGVPETFSGPTPGALKDYDTPYDAFVDIWDKHIIGLIVRETNRSAKQTIDKMKAQGTLKADSRLHQWVDTDADEILVLIAVFMYMSIDPRTKQDEYWRSCSRLNMPLFTQLMAYNRYILLSKFLNFADDSDASQNCQQGSEPMLPAKLSKIAPVISHLNSKFSTLYNLERNISIDESLTLFKGRLSWVQAIRTKAARFGIKSYELCESRTGYMHNFQIYVGKNSEASSDVPPSADLAFKSTKVVLELLRTLRHRGHCVTMDNFYNCPALARYLKSLGIDCLGTLRRNRKNVPDVFRNAKQSETDKGTIIARHSGDVSIVMWKDSKLVTMISTYHDAKTYNGTKAGKPLVKPVSVRDYNNTMGGVDLKDQKLSMYLLERKRGVKWYMKMFKRLMNVSIHNAFIIYLSSLRRRGLPTLTHREFRYKLAAQLDEKHCRFQPSGGEKMGQIMRLKRSVLHVPRSTSGKDSRSRCVVCARQGKTRYVRTECATCEEYMCFENCWVDWHTLPVLKGHDILPRVSRKRRRAED